MGRGVVAVAVIQDAALTGTIFGSGSLRKYQRTPTRIVVAAITASTVRMMAVALFDMASTWRSSGARSVRPRSSARFRGHPHPRATISAGAELCDALCLIPGGERAPFFRPGPFRQGPIRLVGDVDEVPGSGSRGGWVHELPFAVLVGGRSRFRTSNGFRVSFVWGLGSHCGVVFVFGAGGMSTGRGWVGCGCRLFLQSSPGFRAFGECGFVWAACCCGLP